MNKVFYILSGLFFIFCGCYGIYTEKFAGISSVGTVREISMDSNFVEFVIMVGFSFYIGIMLIYKTLNE